MRDSVAFKSERKKEKQNVREADTSRRANDMAGKDMCGMLDGCVSVVTWTT